jgi:MraZ protein
MFLGRFYHNLDDKGRLIIPARFRDDLAAEGAYVMQGFDQNLIVLPKVAFDTLSHRINKMSMTDPTARMLRRLLYSSANHVGVDKSGRILLPQYLREAANLDVQVVIIGGGDYFEIWSPDEWTKQDELLLDAQTNAHRFSALDLTSE